MKLRSSGLCMVAECCVRLGFWQARGGVRSLRAPPLLSCRVQRGALIKVDELIDGTFAQNNSICGDNYLRRSWGWQNHDRPVISARTGVEVLRRRRFSLRGEYREDGKRRSADRRGSPTLAGQAARASSSMAPSGGR